MHPLRLAILISGRGSNMLAIARACHERTIDARITLVASDRAAAAGLQAAEALNLSTACVERSLFPDRSAFETMLAERIARSEAELVVLAGFMRVFGTTFVESLQGRLINIHPSLLPRHKGLDTHRRALDAGDRVHGASVHYVTPELDGGPVIAQARVPVLPDDTPERLSARVQTVEHKLYPMVIGWIAAGRLRWRDGAPLLDGRRLELPEQLSDAA
jgi:phosphoribosylglycinamide formyltransferase 1